jgi:hypothetical protein
MRARIDVLPTAAERKALRPRDMEAQGLDYSAGETIAETTIWSRQLNWYLEGWAEADVAKIFAATAHGYRFDDPLVGAFSRWSFPIYFEHLRAKFARAGAIMERDFAFDIHGPMDAPRRRGRLKFFREAPRLGLTGITFITIGERGIIAESVAYDLNLASDVLRNPSIGPAGPARS